MKFNERLFQDVSKVAEGAASALGGLRQHIESRGPLSARGDTVSREEFEAVAAMAAKARETQDALLQRIAALEAKVGSTS